MSTKLTQMPASFCPDQCKMYTPQIETEKMYNGDTPYVVYNILSCEHENACEMWFHMKEKKHE